MFAILFTDKMDGFYSIITSFPTVVYSLLVIVCIFYWLVAFLGVIDFDILDMDAGDMGGEGASAAGLAMKLGLTGVPLPITVSLLSLIGFLLSYYAVHFSYPLVPDTLEFIAALVIFVVTLIASIILTGIVIKPLRRFFQIADQHVEKNIVGRTGIVRTGRVDKNFGEAVIEDGGAGLIVKVRPYNEEEFKRGDRVVLLEYSEIENIYKVISEAEFKS